MHHRVPTALPDDPTTATPVTWERIDEDTVRVRLSGPATVRMPSAADDDAASDGIPQALEVEHSSTVSVALPDLDVAFEAICGLARRDKVPFDVMRLRRDPKTTRIEAFDVMTLTGQERVPFVPKVLAVTILNWQKFQIWFPRVLREAEVAFFRTMDPRKATAVMLRLKAFARQVASHTPPKGVNHDVLHLE